MTMSQLFIIMSIICFSFYILNIVNIFITKDIGLFACISGWLACAFWLLVFVADRYKSLKKIEKDEENGKF